MELSQTALATLLLVGVPAGAVLSIVYALTGISCTVSSWCIRLLVQVKDFIFVVLAGIVAVLLVYYVNDGEFRYLVLLGMIGGYALTHAMLSRLVLRIREAVLHMLAIPIVWIWSFSLGRLWAKARMASQVKRTEKLARELETLASNGF